MTTKELQAKRDKLFDLISQEVSSSTMDLIIELIEVEISIEKECNK